MHYWLEEAELETEAGDEDILAEEVEGEEVDTGETDVEVELFSASLGAGSSRQSLWTATISSIILDLQIV